MAQGTRITKNILYDNTSDDLFTEVNHGPTMVDHNIFLSETSIRDWSQGGAFAHNLISGRIVYGDIPGRYTPYHLPHSTKVAGLSNILGGDNRFFNNVFIRQDYDNSTIDMDRIDAVFYGLQGYEITKYGNTAEGNLYYNGAPPYPEEKNATEFPKEKPVITVAHKNGELVLNIEVGEVPVELKSPKVTTDVLGATLISEAIFEAPDQKEFSLTSDFFGNMRNENNPMPGPFTDFSKGKNTYLIISPPKK